MWAYLFSKPRTDGRSDEEEVDAAEESYMLPATNAQPIGVSPLFIHLGKKRVWVLVKADLNDAQASILSDNDRLLTGTTKLLWWEPIMASDFQRTLIENEQEEPGFKVCKIDLRKAEDKAAILAMVTQNLPDGPRKDFLVEMVESLPDGPEKERLLEILRRDAKKPSTSPVADKEAELLAIVIRNLPDGEDKDQLLELLARNASVPGNADLPGFMADFEALLVRALRRVSPPPAVITARDIMMKMEMDRLEGVKKADLSEVLAYDNKETKH